MGTRSFVQAFFFVVKMALRVLIAFALIPLLILALLANMFPDFTLEADALFFVVFICLNAMAYLLMWRPISRTLKAIDVLFEGMEYH